MVLNKVSVHFVCNILVCTCLVVGGGFGLHVSNDERGGVQFLFSFIMVVICACISKRCSQKANKCQ